MPQRGAPNRRVYELTDEGRQALEGWVQEPSANPNLKEEFVIKLVLAHVAHVPGARTLLDRQRTQYFGAIRQLEDLAGRSDSDTVSRLLIGGASLYLEALLKWIDMCEELLSDRDLPDQGPDR